MKIVPGRIKEIFTGRHLNFFDVEYSTKSGRKKTWEVISRGDVSRLREEIFFNRSFSDGTMIVAQCKETSKVVMLKEYRVSAGRYVFSFPAGLADVNENDQSVVAVREFKEETGLDLEVVKVSRPMYTSVGLTNEKINIAYGYYSGVVSKQYQEDSEEADIVEVDREKAREILFNPNREIDLRSAALLDAHFKLGYFSGE